ncbi:hypothetical protein SMB34_03520 [Thalassospira permensis NBRC 106175]|uniref:Uncharacterized protein n=1 Tax=Thalassospira permensis NBRC 106175 TaxID=1353532 RepID=A0ABR4TQ50_9PROT|nr:hypothetical protein SMB34_03520 [Thalassospira permensis NBRC 106175]
MFKIKYLIERKTNLSGQVDDLTGDWHFSF